MSFQLHPRLEADTELVCDWPLCRVLLMKDARYFWLILVPRRDCLTEITDLSPQERATLMEETARAGAVIKDAGAVKLNIAALGNQVPQLHMHVIGRAPGDPAWPNPVWGRGEATPYDPGLLAQRLAAVRSH
jgi:diadenosine tetraphosphate (Ap4A) HIT family hydrolase